MPKTARPYQSAAIEATLLALREHPVLVAPTGTGKTYMGVQIVQRTGARCLWVAHRRELIHQAADAVRDAGGRCGLILAGERADPSAPIQIASVQTLAKRDLPPADLLVIDEAHHSTSNGYRALIDHYPLRLGLTATPFRLDGKGLGEAKFGRIIVAAYTDELCADGTLHAPVVYAAPPPDLRAVKKTAGDYNLGQLGDAIRSAGLDGPIVRTWEKRALGKRTVAFAVDIDHAEMIAAEFRKHGHPAEVVTGATPKPERAGILARLAAGVTQIVTNVGVWTEGVDIPALECAIIARPTASLCLHIQQIGRIMRSCEGKDGAVVLDHSGNYERHGLVTDRLVYSLEGKVKKEVGGAAPTRACPECAKVVPAAARTCPECGYEFPVKDRVSESEVELQVVGHADSFAERSRRWDGMVQTALRIVRWQANKGREFGWDETSTTKAHGIASSKFKARYGAWPVTLHSKLVDPTACGPGEWEQLRAHWRSIGISKGWSGAKVSWFVRKNETEARGSNAEKVSCAVRMDDGTLCGRPGRSMCQSHVTKMDQGRPMGEPWDFKRKNLDPKCSIIMDDGSRCDRDAVVGRICTMHQSRKRKGIAAGLPYHRGHPIKDSAAS